MGLGVQITQLRLQKAESLQQVADAVGVSKAHIWELEKGCDVAPNFYPVAARVWRLLASYTVAATGQGAEPLRSAAPWPSGGGNVAA